MTTYPTDITESWPNTWTTETLEGKDALRTLLRGLKFIPNYWLSAGTLLGLERDNGFIPYDTDIDIAVPGYWDRENLPIDFKPIQFVEYKGKPMQSAYIHVPTNIIFDVFHYWASDEPGKIINVQGHGHIKRSTHLVAPTTQKEYLGHTFSVPYNIDGYLTEWYGDWRTPVIGGKTEWQQ